MPDERPRFMVDDIDSCPLEPKPAERVTDLEALDLVLTAGADQSNETAKERRRAEYRELFPNG